MARIKEVESSFDPSDKTIKEAYAVHNGVGSIKSIHSSLDEAKQIQENDLRNKLEYQTETRYVSLHEPDRSKDLQDIKNEIKNTYPDHKLEFTGKTFEEDEVEEAHLRIPYVSAKVTNKFLNDLPENQVHIKHFKL
jgi:hypothetical protein